MSAQRMVTLEEWRTKMLAKSPPPKPRRLSRWWWRLMLGRVRGWIG